MTSEKTPTQLYAGTSKPLKINAEILQPEKTKVTFEMTIKIIDDRKNIKQ